MQGELRVDDLPGEALAAARAFHADWIERAEAELGQVEALAIVLPAASYDHRDWRRALARDMARAHARKRVNVVGGSDSARVAATLAYLAGAPGVTGQYLETDGQERSDPAE